MAKLKRMGYSGDGVIYEIEPGKYKLVQYWLKDAETGKPRRRTEVFEGTFRQACVRMGCMHDEKRLMGEIVLMGIDEEELERYGLGRGTIFANRMSAREVSIELEKRKLEESQNVLFSAWSEKYLSTREKLGERRKSTLDKDRTHSKHLLRYLGDVKLVDISPDTVRGMYADMRASGMGDETLISCHGLLKRIMADAYENDRVQRNVMDKVKQPERTTEIKRGKLEPEDASRLVQIVLDGELTGYKVAVFIGLAIGARLGEVLGLEWRHVHADLQRPYVEVAQQHTRHDERAPLKTEKSGSARGRTVPIDESTVAVLKTWKVRQRALLNDLGIEQTASTPVIVNEVGNWVTHSNFERWFRTFCVGNGYGRWLAEDGRQIVEVEVDDPLAGLYAGDEYLILWQREGRYCDEQGNVYSRINPNPNKKLKRHYDGLRYHWLRHTHFSLRLANGEDIPTCQAIGGWKDPRVLMTVYAHPLDEKVWASAGFMDKLSKCGA